MSETKARYTPEQEVFAVHYAFTLLAGNELFTQPLIANNKHPDRIRFTRLMKAKTISFHPTPKDDKQAYKLVDDNGYTFYNQYPCVRRDIPENEGDHRFNLGVEYPFYQSILPELPRDMQYEYCDLEFFLNKVVRGIREMTIVVNTEATTPEDKQRRERAVEKGKALEKLYLETLVAFSEKYPAYVITIEAGDAVVGSEHIVIKKRD